MNGFGYDPMSMYNSNSPYQYNSMQQQNMQQNQQPNDPNQQEQQSIADHLRTCVSGLSAMTGISYGTAIIFKAVAKFFKLFQRLLGTGRNPNEVLEKLWNATSANSKSRSLLKYVILGFTVFAQWALFLFIRHKRKQIEIKAQEAHLAEEAKKEAMDDIWDQEISMNDFKVSRDCSTIEEVDENNSSLFWCSTDSESEPVEVKGKKVKPYTSSWNDTYHKYSEEGWTMAQY